VLASEALSKAAVSYYPIFQRERDTGRIHHNTIFIHIHPYSSIFIFNTNPSLSPSPICFFDLVGGEGEQYVAASPSHFCELPHVLPQATDLQLQTEGLDGAQYAAQVPEAGVPGGDKPEIT
jgi:hypothetical protein